MKPLFTVRTSSSSYGRYVVHTSDTTSRHFWHRREAQAFADECQRDYAILHLANAAVLVARANHYMVGLVGDFDWEHLTSANQLLIDRELAGDLTEAEADLAMAVLQGKAGRVPL